MADAPKDSHPQTDVAASDIVSSGGFGDGARPLYDSADFSEYCAEQKRKGLRRSLWRTLPQMWEEELKFRAEFEGAINKACGLSSPNIPR